MHHIGIGKKPMNKSIFFGYSHANKITTPHTPPDAPSTPAWGTLELINA
jgi:hypothetical protein